ncbi:Zinc finger BED domain-containing protein RICESLEEPER 2 [Linum grandiflorum]
MVSFNFGVSLRESGSTQPLMSVEEVSSNPDNFAYDAGSNIAMSEITEATQTANATESEAVNQNLSTVEPKNEAFQRKKRQKTSIVWESFKVLIVGKLAQCIYCKEKFRLQSSGATSHLGRHLTRCVKKPGNLPDKSQQQLTLVAALNNTESVKAVESFRYDHAKVTRVNATADLFSTYAKFKGKVKQLLRHVQQVSVTTDLWKVDHQNLQYMVVTCHFVDDKCNLQKRILNFCGMEPPHTGINVSDALYKCLADWDVDRKIWSITLDNASYNDVAVKHLKDTLSYLTKLPLGGDLFHVRCCAHIINIMVQYGLKEIEGTIQYVRESVKYVGASEIRVNLFSEIAKQLRLTTKKLVLDVPTRWNSTYHMLSVALKLKAIFPRFAERDSSYKWLPTEEDWIKAENVCEFLHLFSDVTNLISGSSYPTVHLLLIEGNFSVQRCKYEGYGQKNVAILDPRNKLKFIEVSFKDLYDEDNYLAHVQLVREKLYTLYNEYAEEYKERNVDIQTVNVVGVGTDASTTTSVQEKRQSGRAKFNTMVRSGESSSSSGMKKELDGYLESPLEEADEESKFNVLEWWKKERGRYKILSKMACEIMAIPITSVASESAFSTGGRVIDSKRASLGKNTVEALLCSEDWLRDYYSIESNGWNN